MGFIPPPARGGGGRGSIGVGELRLSLALA